MTYIASIPTLYSDACITYATQSVSYFVLSKNAPFSYRSALWKRVVFGLLAGMTLDKAIAMTDEALYETKRCGKNRMVASRVMQPASLGAGFPRE